MELECFGHKTKNKRIEYDVHTKYKYISNYKRSILLLKNVIVNSPKQLMPFSNIYNGSLLSALTAGIAREPLLTITASPFILFSLINAITIHPTTYI